MSIRVCDMQLKCCEGCCFCWKVKNSTYTFIQLGFIYLSPLTRRWMLVAMGTVVIYRHLSPCYLPNSLWDNTLLWTSITPTTNQPKKASTMYRVNLGEPSSHTSSTCYLGLFIYGARVYMLVSLIGIIFSTSYREETTICLTWCAFTCRLVILNYDVWDTGVKGN